MTDDTVYRQAAIDALNLADDKGEIVSLLDVLQIINALPSAQTELENKIRAIGYTGKEGRIYIGGRLFAVRELPQ